MSKRPLILAAMLLLVPGYVSGEAGADATDRNSADQPAPAQKTDWRARRAAREAAAASADEHQHDHGAPVEAARPSGRPVTSTSGDGARKGGRPTGSRGGNVVWLSDSPPSRGDGSGYGGMRGMEGMGGMGMGGERRGPPTKRLWLRAGTDPQKSGFAREDAEAPPEILLVTPQGDPKGAPLPAAEEGRGGLSFETPAQGYYRLYVTTRKVQNDTLNVSVAKSEVTVYSHSGDESERAQALAAVRVLDSAPIEIVREKQPDEKLFFQLKSGDEQSFVVLQKGLPLQGAQVRFISHNGWTREAVTDEQGRVSFQIVRDYFPSWENFQKRFKANYLVVAEASAAEPGRYREKPYGNVRYQATLSGNYYPSPYDYRSYAWGLGVGFSFLLFSGSAVYLYRRRRVKPYREVQFHEKN